MQCHWLLAGDEPGAERVLLEARQRGADTAILIRDVIGPALSDIGAMWSCGDVSVAEEHLASSMALRLLARDAAGVPTPRLGAPRILLACLSGEFHDLGLRLATDVARETGWDAECLGANVPRAALLSFVSQRPPEALAFSVSTPAHVPECARTIEDVRAAAPGTAILVGGLAFRTNPELVPTCGADAYVPCTVSLRDWLRARMKSSGHVPGHPDGVLRRDPGGLPSQLPGSLRRKLTRRPPR